MTKNVCLFNLVTYYWINTVCVYSVQYTSYYTPNYNRPKTFNIIFAQYSHAVDDVVHCKQLNIKI